MHIDRRLLGWGVFFILVGAVPLAVRANLVAESQVSSWFDLWPLLLVGWGLGLLLRRTPLEWVGGGLSAVVFGLMAGGALATGFGGINFGSCGGGEGSGTSFATQTGTLANGGRINVEFSCGTLAIGAVDGTDWSVAGTGVGGRGPRVEASDTSVSIRTPAGGAFFQDVGQNNWTVGVPRTPSVALGVTLNAGRGSADLSGANLTSTDLTVNAGDFRLDLVNASQAGDLDATVNAGKAVISLPAGDHSADVAMNAGGLEICVPSGAMLRVDWSGTLGSNDLGDAGLTEIDDDTWITPGFDEAQPHLELDVSATAGSFDLTIGGTCGA
jgi:hypothetical protein